MQEGYREQFFVTFVSSVGDVLFTYSTLEDELSVNLHLVTSICQFVPERKPEIVCRLDMHPYIISAVSCMNILCIFISLKSSVAFAKNNSMAALSLMMALSTSARKHKRKDFDFEKIVFPDCPSVAVEEAFSELSDGNPVEYCCFVSPDCDVYCSFGKSSLTTRTNPKFDVIMNIGLSLAQVVDNNRYVIEDDCDLVAGFDFLPYVKILGFFHPDADYENIKGLQEQFSVRILALWSRICAMYDLA